MHPRYLLACFPPRHATTQTGTGSQTSMQDQGKSPKVEGEQAEREVQMRPNPPPARAPAATCRPPRNPSADVPCSKPRRWGNKPEFPKAVIAPLFSFFGFPRRSPTPKLTTLTKWVPSSHLCQGRLSSRRSSLPRMRDTGRRCRSRSPEFRTTRLPPASSSATSRS